MLFQESGVMCPVHSGSLSSVEIRAEVDQMLKKQHHHQSTISGKKVQNTQKVVVNEIKSDLVGDVAFKVEDMFSANALDSETQILTMLQNSISSLNEKFEVFRDGFEGKMENIERNYLGLTEKIDQLGCKKAE